MEPPRYAIGVQSFERLIKSRAVYVDKTEYVYDLVSSASTYYFLSRPRRFGKSLFLSTLKAYFEGRKDLFEGTAIYDLETEWNSYPVLHFDFSPAEAREPKIFEGYLINELRKYERAFGVEEYDGIGGIGARLGNLIENVNAKTGKEVVVLIDEYDKGIIETFDNHEKLEENQNLLRPFFSQLKAQNDRLRFCFITGIARFRHYTIFSGFNNPTDISLNEDFADICGITMDELLSCFDYGIRMLAESLKLSFEETLERLRLKYDGYRFTKADTLVFNPVSILTCMYDRDMRDYWLQTGTSKVFYDFLVKMDFDITTLEDLWAAPSRLEGTYTTDDPVPLLFQNGYLTIKDYQEGMYRLGIPNGEVRSALVDDLIPKFMGISQYQLPEKLFALKRFIRSGDIDGFMTLLQSMIAGIPYHEMDLQNLEKTYHLVFYQVFLMMGIDSRCEIATSGGRIDMVAKTSRYVYVMEFKLGGTVDEALAQIDDKGYALQWRADGRQVYKIGVVFSPQTRTIEAWKTIQE